MLSGLVTDALAAMGKGRVILRWRGWQRCPQGRWRQRPDQRRKGNGLDRWRYGRRCFLAGNDGDDSAQGWRRARHRLTARLATTPSSPSMAMVPTPLPRVSGLTTSGADQTTGGTDTINGTPDADFINGVDQFANSGTDLTLDGDQIPDPTHSPAIITSGSTMSASSRQPVPKFSISSRASGRILMLARLGSASLVDQRICHQEPCRRFGDGTYGVHLGNYFLRVDNDLVEIDQQGDQQKLIYTALGEGGSFGQQSWRRHTPVSGTLGSNSFPSQLRAAAGMDVFTDAFQSSGTQLYEIDFSTPLRLRACRTRSSR